MPAIPLTKFPIRGEQYFRAILRLLDVKVPDELADIPYTYQSKLLEPELCNAWNFNSSFELLKWAGEQLHSCTARGSLQKKIALAAHSYFRDFYNVRELGVNYDYWISVNILNSPAINTFTSEDMWLALTEIADSLRKAEDFVGSTYLYPMPSKKVNRDAIDHILQMFAATPFLAFEYHEPVSWLSFWEFTIDFIERLRELKTQQENELLPQT